MIEFLAQMPIDTKIFLTMANLALAAMLIHGEAPRFARFISKPSRAFRSGKALRLRAITHRLDEQAEGCWSLAAAGIVEVIAGVRLTPFFEWRGASRGERDIYPSFT
jgi:hypothetical protein